MPPAVLMTTASSAPPGAIFGKRTRSEPASHTRRRLLPRASAATESSIRPTARLPAKVALSAGSLASTFSPRGVSPCGVRSPSPDGARLHRAYRGRRNRRWRRAPSPRNGRRVRGQSRDTVRPARWRFCRASANSAMARPMSLMIDGWMPSVGSSSSNNRGRITSARPMASCCCWPPERSPPRRRSMSLSTGNSENTSSGTLRSSRLSGAKPVSQVFLDGQKRKDFAALRHDRRCPAGPDPAAAAVMSSPSQMIVPRLTDAGRRAREQAGLADAVAAEHAGHLAGLRFERHAAQRLRRAVVQIDALTSSIRFFDA